MRANNGGPIHKIRESCAVAESKERNDRRSSHEALDHGVWYTLPDTYRPRTEL